MLELCKIVQINLPLDCMCIYILGMFFFAFFFVFVLIIFQEILLYKGQVRCTKVPLYAWFGKGLNQRGLLYVILPCISARGCF